jgi:membrane associated rhomboid family serine protease
MLSDRSYMRHDFGRQPPNFLLWFLGTLAAIFVLQRIGEVFFGSQFLLAHGSLSSQGLRSGEIWTPLTYALLHGNLTHLLLNGLGLFFIGRYLQEALGPTRLAWLVLVGALGGALAWIGIHFSRHGHVVGASGVVMAFLAVFACLQPRRPMTVLLFFIIPVTVQPIWLVSIITGVELLGFLTQELPRSGSLYGIAHSAHLGGLAAGWLFHRFVLARPAALPGIEPPAWLRKRAVREAASYRVNVDEPPARRPSGGVAGASGGAAHAASSAALPPGSREALRVEVDRILDKINLHGFGSLTEAEKRVLDQARQQLSHR